MQSLAFKMLFHKKGTASAILAIGLLIALLTSVSCLVDNINAQTTALTQLASIGDTYIAKNQNSASLSDSQISANLLPEIKDNSNIKYATNQQLTQGTITASNQTYDITVRGVDDVKAYLTKNSASINGSVSKTAAEANIGIVLANLVNIQKNDIITLTINGQSTQLKISGVTRTQTQSDSQLIIPLTTLQNITSQTSTVSYIEFSVKDTAKSPQTIANLTSTLPSNIQILSTQQVISFASNINDQTVNFIDVWSIAIYIVVIAASYVTASRLINESEDDIYTLRTLGATKRGTLNLVITYVIAIGLLGSLLGLSVGIVGTQIASTAVRWVLGNSQLAPFIDVNQTLQILVISLICAVAGGIYPAIKGVSIVTRENPS
jgi:ABC-type transport system, involved in lipoprotein release, permease component